MSQQIKRSKLDPIIDFENGFKLERSVGIEEFLGAHKPFYGILKNRFEDFVVHEIDLDDKEVKLTDLSGPEAILKEKDVNSEKIEAIHQSVEKLIDSNFLDSIESYVSSNYQSQYPEILINDLTKEDRKSIHDFIKVKYPQLESRTESKNDQKIIKVMKNTGHNRRDRKWPSEKPDYVHFVVYKENLETIQIVNELSKLIGSTTKNFTFAGNKDKRAITTQMFSAFRTDPLKIWQSSNSFNRRSRNQATMHVGHFRFSDEPLRLGDLNGNKFEIILRQISSLALDSLSSTRIDEINQNLESIKNNGFINYYGMQRFGSHRIDSHRLGVLILKKEFKSLVKMILCEKPLNRSSSNSFNQNQDQAFNDAIKIWKEERDAGAAYKKLPRKFTNEGSLLRALTKVDPNDFHGALCLGLTRSSRLTYLHAYQSFLWNRISSFRMREYGLKVVVGDLVWDEKLSTNSIIDGNDIDEIIDQESSIDSAIDSSDSNIRSNIPENEIILITEDNINQYTIYDVVIPVIGTLSKLPTNRCRDQIDILLREDGITMENFGSLGKQWCCNGSYRKLLVRPKDFRSEWIEYFDEKKSLILSDLDRINGKKLQDDKKILTSQDGNDRADQKKLSLKIEFILPKSSYATMMIREITKISSINLENKPWHQFLL
ncbi:Pseudouridylate synthase 7 -like protein [Sarcoptes scabiei]|uniref:Pseudouridylate synthase 7 -like protein n=1 Tax=Sarcoptes scabiei TaxID=52283 RepID=A0A834VBY9_SARSC|nr:Pseudouridylate synthase 7 -like protein [Sarcoptes scabiei]